MRIAALVPFIGLIAALAGPSVPAARGQDSPPAAAESNARAGAALVVGHPFTAIKYARRIRVLPNGKLQFIRNERYPTRIARDADGRLMMQMIFENDLESECDRPDMLVPPPCPAWGVFMIDPVANTVTHWTAGEIGYHGAVVMPLSQADLDRAADATGELPNLAPDFTDEDGKVSTADLGEKEIDGVVAHGVRSTLRYMQNQNGKPVQLTRIHEVWTAPEMELIVRVVDGDPQGEETAWGLEKISLSPDASLFRPPDDYIMEHRHSDQWAVRDFECLDTWFVK